LWVQLAQACQHSRVGHVTDPLGRQRLEGTSRRPFGQEGLDCRCCPIGGLGRGSSRLRGRGPASGPSPGADVAACRSMRLIRFPSWSMTAARQLSRHCWVDVDLVALPPSAGAARAMRGNRRRRARVTHVPSRSRACSRQVSARAHVEEAAMGALRCVEILVPSRCTRSRPAGRGPASGERAFAGGGAWCPSTALEQRCPGHRTPCGVISRQARHTRSPWVSSHASGGAAPIDRGTERRWDTNDCRQLHPVVEAPSRRAHRGIGQNHIPEE